MTTDQAVATTACLLDGRVTWGVGTGEYLNEHVIGTRWPEAPARLEMIEEAVWIVRRLLTGESMSHRGTYYEVEDARLFDLPEEPVPIVFSAFGPKAAELAASQGDGLWVLGVEDQTIEHWPLAGGSGPVWTQISLCWDPDEDDAVDRAYRIWPNTALPGQLARDLRPTFHIEQATESVT